LDHGAPQPNVRLHGIGVSGGIVIGPAYLVERRNVMVLKRHIHQDQVQEESERFLHAVDLSRHQLLEIKDQLAAKELREHSYILDAHRMMLEDKMLVEETAEIIVTQRVNAEWALEQNVERLRQIFAAIDDEYLRERGNDIDSVANRVLHNLSGKKTDGFSGLEKGAIVVAHDLSPVDIGQLDRHDVAGVLTDVGGPTSHTAIMARSLEIAAVVGMENVTSQIEGGETVILDGTTGEVILRPSEELLAEYRGRERIYEARTQRLLAERDLPAETLDGNRIRLEANVELPEETSLLREYGAEGIGLYRTEFLFLDRVGFPTEEEHLSVYRVVAEAMAPHPTTLRTFDLGGDKFVSELGLTEQENPAMGLRAIRFCLREVGVFKSQLKGILRAALYGNLRILLPMISGIGEVRQAKAVIREAMDELRAEGKPFNPSVTVGVMIEVPSACMIADRIAAEADFLSIGTNDLIQYALAVDRVNENVSYLYEPLHPSVLRFIKMVVDAGHGAGIPVAMCGEMAGEPLFVLILLGLGLDSLSMNVASIPRIKKIIRRVTYQESVAALEAAMRMGTAEEIEAMLLQKMREKFPDEFGGTVP
jgi:phosphotransferase system enzyme I (PtsI)